ncbi:MAG TPA: NUDIX hydrolase [Spirochaetota bacterium]|nr:NUDIX hydrolase [Spirochaetota bacterium]
MGTNYRNPVPTVDIIIRMDDNENDRCSIVLIERKNEPYGWAIPGGFVDYGESLEDAAVREAFEETTLKVKLMRQFHTYSDPGRDPRQHTVSTVFIATAEGTPAAADDAKNIGVFNINELPDNIAFDHREILQDFKNSRY